MGHMIRLAAFTKIFLALLVSGLSLLTADLLLQGILLGLELLVLGFSPKKKIAAPAVLFLLFFAALLLGVQLLCGTAYSLAFLSAFRMAIMAISIVLMLCFTRTQQLTAALVQQFRLPYSYAFMVTAVLRFVPDLLAESRSVQEAQACRGYKATGNPLQRLRGYMAVIKPMIFRAIERSEHMAVSLEMRGFAESKQRTFMAATNLGKVDYAIVFFGILLFTAMIKKF